MMADYNGWADQREEERESIDTTFRVSEYEGSGFVEDQARIRFLESRAEGEFNLDQARREAADRVIIGKVLDTVDYVRRRPPINGW